MKPHQALALLALAACASERALEAPAAPAPAPFVDAGSGPPVVVGTVIDARTNQPIEGAAVAGPGGASAQSDAGGRFRLKGLPVGASGPLTATAGDRAGSVLLRPLAGGRLEVVVYVR